MTTNSSTTPNPANLPFVEALYREFLRDRASIPEEWRGYFEDLERRTARHPRGALVHRSSPEVSSTLAEPKVRTLRR